MLDHEIRRSVSRSIRKSPSTLGRKEQQKIKKIKERRLEENNK
jgi:hypothetical protein